jgi:hypothetical protein
MNPIKKAEIEKAIRNFDSIPNGRKALNLLIEIFEDGYRQGYLDGKNGKLSRVYIKRIK